VSPSHQAEAQILKLAAGVLFRAAAYDPADRKAGEGENFVSRQVFDGATDENAVQVSAAIGTKVAAEAAADDRKPAAAAAWLAHPLAFFPADNSVEKRITNSACTCSTTAFRGTC